MTACSQCVTVKCHDSGIRQLLEETGRCVTICEPDSISRIVGKYRRFGSTPEIRQLAYDIVRMECRPYRSFQPAAYVIKVIALCSSEMPFFGYELIFTAQLICTNYNARCELHSIMRRFSICARRWGRPILIEVKMILKPHEMAAI